jgi:hypothetical protein
VLSSSLAPAVVALAVILRYSARAFSALPAWRKQMTDAREYRITRRQKRRAEARR